MNDINDMNDTDILDDATESMNEGGAGNVVPTRFSPLGL